MLIVRLFTSSKSFIISFGGGRITGKDGSQQEDIRKKNKLLCRNTYDVFIIRALDARAVF